MLVNVQSFLRYLYTYWVQPYIYGEITRPIDGLGWLFPEFANLEILLCEPLLN